MGGFNAMHAYQQEMMIQNSFQTNGQREMVLF
jgi:hypothetical protein